MPELRWVRDARTMADMVFAAHNVAVFSKNMRESVIAVHVLGHAVNDLNNGARGCGRAVRPSGHPQACANGRGAIFR